MPTARYEGIIGELFGGNERSPFPRQEIGRGGVNGDGISGWGPTSILYDAGGTVVAIAGRRMKKVGEGRETAREFLEVAVGSTRSRWR
jgi:hypothetical protein